MKIPFLAWPWYLIRNGHKRFLMAEIWMRTYKIIHECLFALRYRVLGTMPLPVDHEVTVETKHPIAVDSPDHLVPGETRRANSTNKKFVTFMMKLINSEFCSNPVKGFLDLGCSGGQLVKDFADLGWLAVGLEGSDYSLKHNRANWPGLAGRNLFTCDITKPFKITAHGQPAHFHLVTMWEVLEHIHRNDLPQLFRNIISHLDAGGYFIASTTSVSDVSENMDLHQTLWSNDQWKNMLARDFPELEPIDLGLKYYQYVRHNEERSFLVFRKRR